MGRKRTLVIVDMQRDFIDGALAVEGGKTAVYNVIRHLGRERYDNIIFTTDWHPFNHCSFKENGGEWPIHCVGYTDGAAIDTTLFVRANENCQNVLVHRKGAIKDVEEYGAFSKETAKVSSNNFIGCDIVVCGIAGDYCVLETLKNLMPFTTLDEENQATISVFSNGITSIDKGDKLNEYLKEHKEINII